MIKGPLALDLMNFGNYVGFISAKGKLKDLSKTDVEPLLEVTISILEGALKEPSFSKEVGTISWELGSATTFKNDILKQGKTVIKGKNKEIILEKVQYWYELVYNLFGNCLFSTLSGDSVQKLFPKAIVDEVDQESKEDIQDGIWCVVFSLPTPAAMALFRAAERELRKYVSKVGDTPATSWYDNVKKLENLEKSKITNKSIRKEFDWLKEKRNEAEHPDKRYTQDEAEGILHHLSGLLKDIYSKNEQT